MSDEKEDSGDVVNLSDSVHVGDNVVGSRSGDINVSGSTIPQCPICLTPLSNDPKLNNGLICFFSGCDARFCEHCESFYRAHRPLGKPPYCNDHYIPPEEESNSEDSSDSLVDFAKNFPERVMPEPPPVPQLIQVKLVEKDLFNSYGGAAYGLDPDKLSLICLFKNEFTKPVRAFKGTMRFSDLFHHHIMSMGVTIELAIPPGKAKKWPGAMSYNQFMSDHSRLASIDIDDLGYELELESVIFRDGTRFP